MKICCPQLLDHVINLCFALSINLSNVWGIIWIPSFHILTGILLFNRFKTCERLLHCIYSFQLGLNPKFHQLDITDQKSIDTFKNYLRKEHGGIDVLVNNAAIAYKVCSSICPKIKTHERWAISTVAIIFQNAATEPFGEQAENSIKVNYFGLLNVCNSLFSILRPNARVVYISSSAASLTRVPGENVKKQLASPNITTEQLTALMNQFVE